MKIGWGAERQLESKTFLRRSQPVIIELFGLPGAGKTTITARLPDSARVHSREEISSAWRRKSILYRAALLVRAVFDFKWMACIAGVIVQTPVRKRESLIRIARLAGTKPWLRAHDGVIVLDQGTLQNLWSIFYIEGISEPPNAALVRLLQSFYDGLAVMIVVIDVPPETAAQRVYSRDMGSSRLDNLAEKEVLARLENAARLPAGILRAVRDAGLPMTTLDGSQTPEALAVQLQEILKWHHDTAGNAPLSLKA